MKNVKFKAYIKDENKIVDVKELSFKYDEVVYESGRYTEVRRFRDVELLQSTGLKDDFGNELFEGYIFESRFSEIKYVVYWDDKLASFWIRGEGKEHPLYTLTPFHPRILGNIYENPELLEEVK
nr:MAG TPA: YopX protein [Herelleviridae sp.]